MVIIPWHKYTLMPRHQKDSFIGIILQKDNSAICYVAGEERKYKRALNKKEKEAREEPNLLLL